MAVSWTKEARKGVVLHGVLYPWSGSDTTEEMIDTFARLVTRQSDIYVVTYPRSGTTWTLEMVWQIISNGKIDNRRTDIRMPWLEGIMFSYPGSPFHASTPDMIEKICDTFPSPRVFKSHLQYGLVPKGRDEATKPRYIYVMRNPKDTAVSFYHFHHARPYPETPSWEEFFNGFTSGEAYYGSWFDHVLSWWTHRSDPNILFLKYEDMIKDPPGTVQQIACFIGKELCPEIIECIINQTTFSAMKKEESVNYKWAEGVKGDYMRKGRVGDWRNFFTKEQSELFDKVYAEKMAGTGLEFEYDGNKENFKTT